MIENSTLEEAARWFAVLRRNVMTVDERQSFDHWMADAANRAALAQVEHGWELAGRLASSPAERPPVQISRRTAMRAAGGLAASMAAGLFAADRSGALSRWGWDGEVETGIGEQREVTLPEGSVIHLNVLSRVRWRLTDTERQVSLDAGDALFTVSRNAERPFTVRTTGGVVRVLGTVFSVSLRDENGGVAVREGHVAFTSRAGGQTDPVQLLGGQAVRFGSRGVGKVTPVAPDQVAEWCDHFVTFDQAELGDVAQELGRYFPLKVRIEPAEAAKRRVTLRLKLQDQNSTLDLLRQLLDARLDRKSAGRVVLRLPS
ncbi:MAG TPA: FecR domain-containing protein [Magnetospirillaceae bacterium]|nr:FecR domain-containing protein [Magnetospirillaceae bacterium]